MSCHEDYEDYDMAIHEFYHPDYDTGYQALIVCCGLSDFCENLTEEQWKLIIEKKNWKKKLEIELEETNKKLEENRLLRHKISPPPEFAPSPYTIFERVKGQVSLSGKPITKIIKSKAYYLKQFQNEFNSGKENMNIGCSVFEFGHDLYTGAGNILAAKDFWHLLFTNEGKWRLFTILFLKKQLPLYLLEEKLIKNFYCKDYIYVMKKSFLKRIFDMIFGIKKIKNIKNKGILYQVIL